MNNKGFTLAELLGTIVVLSAVIVALGYTVATKDSTDYLRNQKVILERNTNWITDSLY